MYVLTYDLGEDGPPFVTALIESDNSKETAEQVIHLAEVAAQFGYELKGVLTEHRLGIFSCERPRVQSGKQPALIFEHVCLFQKTVQIQDTMDEEEEEEGE